MTGLPVSSNNVRSSKKRGVGLSLLGILCILVLFVVFIMWTEDLIGLPQTGDSTPYAISKSDFALRHNDEMKTTTAETKMKIKTYLTDDGGDGLMVQRSNNADSKNADDDDDLFFSWMSGGNSKRKDLQKKTKGSDNKFKFNRKHHHQRKNNQDRKHKKDSLRKRIGTNDEIGPLPVVQNINDDNIPLARLSVGSFLHASDALLCRESIIDYVINATDLKDECDGLKKAYTTNCVADEQNEEPEAPLGSSSSRRRLPKIKEENSVIYLQHRLFHWSRDIRSWWFKAPTPVFMSEDRILDEWDDAAFEVEQGWDLSLYHQEDIIRMLRSDEDNVESNRKQNDDVNSSEYKPLIMTVEQEKPLPNPNKTKAIINKPLANLALPITSKHVSDKALTGTLMLQQDNNLMNAVKNQTNTTVTEAQAEAQVSSKAVSDAADMISNILNDPTSVEARTCCTSILNTFHENCSVDEEEELSDKRLFVGVAVVAFCGLVKSLIRNFRIRFLPEAAGCILVGVSAGYILTFYPHHDISFDGNWFLRIMVPPIVFEAALSIDKRSFSRHIVPILLYAVIGTLIATGVTAIVVHEGSKLLHRFCETIPYPEALAFGALISSIDPIAVLSVLSNMGMTDKDTIYVVIFGESLLNDGVAIVLFETLVHFLDDNMIVDGNAVTAAAIHFMVVFMGSLLIGIAYGLCCTLYYWIMIGCQTPLVEVLMFCCWALLPYYVCDGIEWSGIVAVVAAGFIMDIYVVGTENSGEATNDDIDQNGMLNESSSSFTDYDSDNKKNDKGRRRKGQVRRPIFSKEGLLSRKAKTHVVFVTEIIATMMETAIFAYLGLFLFSSRYHWNFYHVVIAITGCCLSRAVMIPSLSLIANWITRMQQSGAICRSQEQTHQSDYPDTPTSKNRPNLAAGVIIDSKMQLVLWFAGLRGAMSFALVEHIPQYDAVSGEGTRFKSELKAMTSACIIFTVFILGGGTFYVTEALGLSPKSKSESKSDHQMEMIGLLSSTNSTDTTEDRAEEIDGEEPIPEYDQNGTTPSKNLRRPGRPVRRQRKLVC